MNLVLSSQSADEEVEGVGVVRAALEVDFQISVNLLIYLLREIILLQRLDDTFFAVGFGEELLNLFELLALLDLGASLDSFEHAGQVLFGESIRGFEQIHN